MLSGKRTLWIESLDELGNAAVAIHWPCDDLQAQLNLWRSAHDLVLKPIVQSRSKGDE
jgi:hypothetical protein